MNPEEVILRELPPPEYSIEERGKILVYFMNLKGDLIREFLGGLDLRVTGTKPELRVIIEEYLEEGTLEYKDLVNFLDSVAPWYKQHVFLYDGSESLVRKWRGSQYVTRLLRRTGFSENLNSRLPLILPRELSLSSIEYLEGREFKIFAVERRDHWERNQDYDEQKTRDDKDIKLRAYIHQVTRGIFIFRWNLVSNTAILQISQLPSGTEYEEVEERFANLIRPCLNLEGFTKLDLSVLFQHILDKLVKIDFTLLGLCSN